MTPSYWLSSHLFLVQQICNLIFDIYDCTQQEWNYSPNMPTSSGHYVTTSGDYLQWLPPVTASSDYLQWLPLANYPIWWLSQNHYQIKPPVTASSDYLQWLPLATYPIWWLSQNQNQIKKVNKNKTTVQLCQLPASGDYLRWLPPVTTSGDYLRWLPLVTTCETIS